jgi:hypothetical protein
LLAQITAVSPDSTRADTTSVATPESLRVGKRVPPPKPPRPIIPAGGAAAISCVGDSILATTTIQDPREALRRGLGVQALEAGSPMEPEPLYLAIPGRDVPEIRVNGLPIASERWPESPILSDPLIAIDRGCLHRYAPIRSPLSATGGPQIDLREADSPTDRAISGFRLTRSSYATFAEEIFLRRPAGRYLLSGSYGTTKTNGRLLWGSVFGDALNLRMGGRLAGGFAEVAYDDGSYRNRLLSTKRGFLDRRGISLRWMRPDTTTGGGIEGALQWRHLDAGWRTLLGETRRNERTVFLHLLGERPAAGGMGALAFECEVMRIRFDRIPQAHRLQYDLGAGIAAGWTKMGMRWTHRISGGITRLAPLAPAPVFSIESETSLGAGPRAGSLLLHASRAVRNRTLPRLPTDGEAWIRQGLDLVEEKNGERPEGLWRGAVEVRRWFTPTIRVNAGADLLFDQGGYGGNETDLVLLGIDQQDRIPNAILRADRAFLSPFVGAEWKLPYGFRASAAGSITAARDGTRAELGLPASRAHGELGWRGKIFRGDLRLDLSLVGQAQSEIATPYARIAPQGIVDGLIRGRIGSADIFFVLANLADTQAVSMSWDGTFMLNPRRHYRAGLCWNFID